MDIFRRFQLGEVAENAEFYVNEQLIDKIENPIEATFEALRLPIKNKAPKAISFRCFCCIAVVKAG